jgi:hypothetical protein
VSFGTLDGLSCISVSSGGVTLSALGFTLVMRFLVNKVFPILEVCFDFRF